MVDLLALFTGFLIGIAFMELFPIFYKRNPEVDKAMKKMDKDWK